MVLMRDELSEMKALLVAQATRSGRDVAPNDHIAGMAQTIATLAPVPQLVEAIKTTLAQHGDAALLLADCRDTITEAVSVLHSQLTTVLQGVQALQAPPATPTRGFMGWLMLAGACAALAIMGAAIWVWSVRPYSQLGLSLDAALVQHYPQLPRPVQDSLTTIYGQYQFQPPGARQKGSR
jgi:hypothetical protein